MKKIYRICFTDIQIEAPFFPADSEDWHLFEINSTQPDVFVNCVVDEAVPAHPGMFIGSAKDTDVFFCDGFVYRASRMGTAEGALTVYRQDETSESTTYFTNKSYRVMMDSRYMWNSLSFAQLMLPLKTVFIHAAYVEYSGKALLFSAPSGTGKSTQAALWQKYAAADIVNGDKAGISFKDDVAYACGVPFCGTSGICKNRSLPLGAIVLLRQSEHNTVRRLNGVDALQAVMRNIHLDLLAPREQQMCVDLLINVLSRTAVFELSCTPDEKAVEVLKCALENGGAI